MTTAVAPAAPRRRFALRFSLRVLLIAFTAFAIGFPIWYRWPYQQEEPQYLMRNGQPDKSQPPQETLVTTWQRQWGGGRLKQGPEWTLRGGKQFARATYRNGVLHGPFEYGDKATLLEQGHFDDGKKSGEWRRILAGFCREIEHYRDGMKDGPFQRVSPTGYVMETGQHERDLPMGEWILFDAMGGVRGRVIHRGDAQHRTSEFIGDGAKIVVVFDEQGISKEVHVDGRVLEDRLGRLVTDGVIRDFTNIKNALTAPTDVEFGNVPPRDGFEFLSQRHEIPIACDRSAAGQGKDITAKLISLPLSSVLTILADRAQLACDWHYGVPCITSPDELQNWQDPTGVVAIQPPSGSRLGGVWDGPIPVAFRAETIASALDYLSQSYGITIDHSALNRAAEKNEERKVTLSVAGHPLRHVIGILLYQTHCRCELRDETLVILPQDAPDAEESRQE